MDSCFGFASFVQSFASQLPASRPDAGDGCARDLPAMFRRRAEGRAFGVQKMFKTTYIWPSWLKVFQEVHLFLQMFLVHVVFPLLHGV